MRPTDTLASPGVLRRLIFLWPCRDMSAYSYDRTKTADYTDTAISSLDKLKMMAPKFREQIKILNKALPRSGIPKLQDAERQFEHIIDALQATEYDLAHL